jgi:hypothetical protein
MSLSEHVTALFVGGLYYWWIGDRQAADLCWRSGAQVLQWYGNKSCLGTA